MYIAHINKEDLKNNVIYFHLNIPSNERIPRIPFEVFASYDNGYHGKIMQVIAIHNITRFHINKKYNYKPFVSIEYSAIHIGE